MDQKAFEEYKVVEGTGVGQVKIEVGKIPFDFTPFLEVFNDMLLLPQDVVK